MTKKGMENEDQAAFRWVRLFGNTDIDRAQKRQPDLTSADILIEQIKVKCISVCQHQLSVCQHQLLFIGPFAIWLG